MTGKVTELGKEGGPFNMTRAGVAIRFLRTKMGPIPGAIWTAADDMTDVVGKKKTPLQLAGGLFVPLSLREVTDTMKARGIPQGTAVSALALLGMGVGTYGGRTEYLAANKQEREKLFERDLKRAEYGDGPLPYSSHMTPEMMKRYEEAKEKKAMSRIETLIRRKPLSASEGKTLSERRERWKEDVNKAKEWFRESGITINEAYDIYRRQTGKRKNKRRRSKNLRKLKSALRNL